MTASARLLARTLDRRSSNLQPPVPSKPARVPVASATSRNEEDEGCRGKHRQIEEVHVGIVGAFGAV